jgi:phage anti-repressor protein
MSNENIINFIKRFTVVPQDFVDELFRFYDENTMQTDIVILLDDVAKWLNCSKYELVETLKRSYVENIDYKINKIPNPNKIKNKYTSNNYKLVLISADCFKRLCMMSRAEKANIVRTYFIDVETQFIRYKNQLMEGLKTDIKRLENDLNPKRKDIPTLNDANGYIYIIKASDEVDDLFKIGRAGNIKKRLFSYQTGKAHEVDLIYVLAVHDMKSAEKCVKSHLLEYQYRTRREIYQVPLDMLKIIIDTCNRVDGAKKQYIKRKNYQKAGKNSQGILKSYYAVFNKDLILPP